LRAFDAVEHQGQCLWRLPFIVAQRDPALGHGIAAYKPIEVELLYNGVGLDVLGIGYERFPEGLRKKGGRSVSPRELQTGNCNSSW
jgi:hypothetical protein